MKNIIALLGIILSVSVTSNSAFAGFGGSRGGGFSSSRSFSSGSSFSRSSGSFGGFRSAPSRSAVTISRPSYSAPVYSRPTVVNHYGSSNDGLLTGMMVGSMMNRSNNGTTVVQSAPPVVYADPTGQQPYVQQPMQVVQQQDSGFSFFKFLLIVSILGIVGYGVYILFYKRDANGTPIKW